MQNFFEKRLDRLSQQGRVAEVEKVADAAAVVAALRIKIGELWGSPHAMAVASFRAVEHQIVRSTKDCNKGFLVSHGGVWNEIVLARRMENRTLLSIRRLTYEHQGGWTMHLGNPGAMLRCSTINGAMAFVGGLKAIQNKWYEKQAEQWVREDDRNA